MKSALASSSLHIASRHLRMALQVVLLVLGALACVTAVYADLRTPSWYDSNAVSAAPDWHYRVPLSIPAGAAVNSTIKADVNFANLLSAMGINGTFDINSVRVVRSTGALATQQQYTDSIYAGITDVLNNNQGEVRFILEDAGPATYYVYFDITQNGTKPANPQTPINGNFEFGTINGASPQGVPGWTTAQAAGTPEMQLRANETVSVTEAAAAAGFRTVATNGNANTGNSSYLMGFRSIADSGGTAVLTKTITVPASGAGNLTIRFRPQGWDSAVNNNVTQYDFLRVRLMNGNTTALDVVGPQINNSYATCPYSPNYGLNLIGANNTGYGRYNYWDNFTGANNHSLGMTATYNRGLEPWVTCTVPLTGIAGQTLTLEIRSDFATSYRSWFLIDDVEWSVVTATVGTPQSFGVNISTPTAASGLIPGQKLIIRAQVDALPTAATNPVTADVYDGSGNLVASGIILYNDGTHGDTTPGDAIWSNDGSVAANPTYTIPLSATASSSWTVRVYAKDASSSAIGSPAGLVRIPGRPNTPYSQTNYYNVDDQLFSIAPAQLSNMKTFALTSDPINGAANPKMIPGAVGVYTIAVTNSGIIAIDNNTITIVDAVPANSTLFTGNFAAGAPYSFVDGALASGLTCPFVALNNLTDCVDFSNDGGATWAYVPTGGYDPAVTHIRFRLSGAMAGDSAPGAPSPSFALNFRVRLN